MTPTASRTLSPPKGRYLSERIRHPNSDIPHCETAHCPTGDSPEFLKPCHHKGLAGRHLGIPQICGKICGRSILWFQAASDFNSLHALPKRCCTSKLLCNQ